MTRRLVLVDSSALIDFSRSHPSPIADAVETLVREGRAAVCTVTAAEILTGCRTAAEYRRMQLWLVSLPWLPVTNECWTRAAALGFNLRRAGVTVPLTDRLVVVTARLHGAELLHHDTHFDEIGDTPDTV